MIDASFRPALRAVETIAMPDRRHGRVLVLRDTQGITDATAAIPPPLVPIVARFDGAHTCAQIAREAAVDLGSEVPVDVVVRLAEQLDQALFLESPRFRKARADIARAFSSAAVRPASHAGGAYHGDRAELAQYIAHDCLARAGRKANGHGRMRALVAPHIDPWRGAVGYGHAYAALSHGLAPEADTFILFGTSHAPMREHFALCRKAFDTPLGAAEADGDASDAIARAAPFDPYADEFNHKREHSLEFQVVFLRHVLGERPFRIVPILAGLGEHQARGSDPAKDDRATRFLDAVREVAAKRAGRVVLVAGADMAHVGPRFGDGKPYDDEARLELEKSDRGSLELAARSDAGGFWADVLRDMDTRRVCGLAPIYALLRTMPTPTKGELLHYEQTVDADDGSIVSHAAVGFYG